MGPTTTKATTETTNGWDDCDDCFVCDDHDDDDDDDDGGGGKRKVEIGSSRNDRGGAPCDPNEFSEDLKEIRDDRPKIREQPSDLVVLRDDPTQMTCGTEGAEQVHWFHKGRPIKSGRGGRTVSFSESFGVLFFLAVSTQDVGVYWCEAVNKAGLTTRSRNATLEIAYLREDFVAVPSNVEVALGETAELRCEPPEGLPTPTVEWFKEGQPVNVGSRASRIRLKEDSSGSLVIQDVRSTDQGNYVCRADNKVGKRETSPARLSVKSPERVPWTSSDERVQQQFSSNSNECNSEIQRKSSEAMRRFERSLTTRPTRTDVTGKDRLNVKKIDSFSTDPRLDRRRVRPAEAKHIPCECNETLSPQWQDLQFLLYEDRRRLVRYGHTISKPQAKQAHRVPWWSEIITLHGKVPLAQNSFGESPILRPGRHRVVDAIMALVAHVW
ncbi:roundabout1-like [Tropilaelaps mercedesae]|uniref:Roundabout1-like n=1 Tax=Tropilaelaps mercedesae TaxID=418985 RepID=A0A1V9XBE5_9ACAR|nr:roundabout1-like [Tropilaelaps mercedesae]